MTGVSYQIYLEFSVIVESPLTKDKIQEKIIDKLALMRGYNKEADPD